MDGSDELSFRPGSEILTRPTRLSHNSRNFPDYICIWGYPVPFQVQYMAQNVLKKDAYCLIELLKVQ